MATARDAGPPRFSPTIALITLARQAETGLAELLAPHDLSVRTYGILGHVAAHPGLSLSALARRSNITVQSTQALIRALAASGLLTSDVASPGLPARVTVTPKGRSVLRRVAGSVAELDEEEFATPAMRTLADGLRVATTEKAARASTP